MQFKHGNLSLMRNKNGEDDSTARRNGTSAAQKELEIAKVDTLSLFKHVQIHKNQEYILSGLFITPSEINSIVDENAPKTLCVGKSMK